MIEIYVLLAVVCGICKNRRPYNLYCVDADVKPINQSVVVSVSSNDKTECAV